jgi:Tol biopolymer transport system component
MVFQSYRDDNWEIYMSRYVNDIGTVSRLTFGEAYDGEPRLNPGCTRVVFTSDRDGNDELYTMDTFGNNVSRLTWNDAEDYAPSWSADGSKIAFVSRRDGNNEIYSIRADGSGLQRLTFTAEPEFGPAFSPDGTRIAWVRAVDDQLSLAGARSPGNYGHDRNGMGSYSTRTGMEPEGSVERQWTGAERPSSSKRLYHINPHLADWRCD